MAPVHSLYALVITSFIITTTARIAPFHKAQLHRRHEAPHVGKRQDSVPIMGPPPGVPASTTTAPGVLKYITPSPGASPVAVTKQSQIVTSYVPQFTLCELPPVEFFSLSPAPSSAPTTAPYKNYSVSIPSGNGTCTTIYSPTITMVCATTLTALVDKYTVSNCAQDLTFSAEYGYVLVTPTPTPTATSMFYDGPASRPSSSSMNLNISTVRGNVTATSVLLPRDVSNATVTITSGPSIETLTTYYLAPWQQLTAGTAPSEVDLKVCRTFATNDSTECVREYQVWSTSLVTMTSTTVTRINISTTIHGMSQVLVETFVANVTEQLTTFSMSTTMDLEFQTEWTSTHSATRPMSTSTAPTVYETMTVQLASQTSSSQDTTSTTTIHRTSTVYAGTSTVTRPVASAVLPSFAIVTTPPSTSVDFASMLGIGGS